MSISIYYTARRSTPISNAERAQIVAVENKYAVEHQIETDTQTDYGYNW